MTKISVEKLQELLDYDKIGGIIKVKKSGKVVLPNVNENGTCTIYDPETNSRRRLKYQTLAFILGSSSEINEGYKVLSLDMTDSNIKFQNLRLVRKDVSRAIGVVLRNL